MTTKKDTETGAAEAKPESPKTETKAPGSGDEGSHRFETLRREIDRLFDEFGPSTWRLPFRRTSGLELPGPPRERFPHSPAIDFVENDKAYLVTVELPGMTEKDVEIKLSNHHLSIRGEKTEEKKEEGADYYLSERSYGAFSRLFRVPEGVDASGISAEMKAGILTVTLPKTPEAKEQEKMIKIKAS